MKLPIVLIFALVALAVENNLKFGGESIYEKEIKGQGYTFENHNVTTTDGYILHIWRISNPNVESNHKVALLQHGLLDDSYTFFALKKEFSLAYLVADQGYDVWVSNVRGNIYSYQHTNKYYDALNPWSDYWNFSFEQMSDIDLGTIIDYVKDQTKVEKLDYIGHSQGTTIFFVKYMNNPEYIEKNINKFIALGPVPSVANAESSLMRILEHTRLFELFPMKSIMFTTQTIRNILSGICYFISGICGDIVDGIVGTKPTYRIKYSKYISAMLKYEPGGSSKQNLLHWLQCARAKRLQRYDFGKTKNMEKYGNEYPPVFDVEKIKKWNIPSIFTLSDVDTFSSIEDVNNFVNLIENKNIYEVLTLKNYNHLDYLWAEDAKKDIYEKVIQFLAKEN